MRIVSWNVNGIRSIHKKGFLEWFSRELPDILCLQETRVNEECIPKELLKINDYYSYWNHAEKKGYSGVCVYTKKKPLKVKKLFNEQGRALVLKYSDFMLMNIYFPHGGRGKERLPYKLRVYDEFLSMLKKGPVILCGDFNVAHKELDLARPRSNLNNVMFTPEERARIDGIISKGFIDSFREFHKEGGHYTWWPYMHNARARNIGWRIDYIFISQVLKDSLKDAFILKDVKGSDHCPIGIEL